MKKSLPTALTLLRTHGLKVTNIRIAIVTLLQKATAPRTAEEIARQMRRIADTATCYRTLRTLTDKGIVTKLSLFEDKASFALTDTPSHAHYVVCTHCQTIEPITLCLKNADIQALHKAKKFTAVRSHALSFFGTCKKCARAIP
ncbi:MAG TPA: Fur family transcriptional regulator [Candidatus Paceibacterota bacterium]|nr:Fur family transcriptional regulator [Candidatus Paceibacterota bacterium]